MVADKKREKADMELDMVADMAALMVELVIMVFEDML